MEAGADMRIGNQATWALRQALATAAGMAGVELPGCAMDAAAGQATLAAARAEIERLPAFRAERARRRGAWEQRQQAEHRQRQQAAARRKAERKRDREREAAALLALPVEVMDQVLELRKQAAGIRQAAGRAPTMGQQRAETARAAELEQQANGLIDAH